MRNNMGTESDSKKRIRELKGTLWSTQGELAERAGINQSQMSRFLNDKTPTQLQSGNLFKLLDSLGAKIVFPGDSNASLSKEATPEAVAIDKLIVAMRKSGAVDAAIRDAVIRQIESMFEKNNHPENDKERRLAS